MLRSGLIGRSITASRSPLLHQEEARAQGVALSYELFDFTDRGLGDDALPAMLAKLRDSGFSGVNVTYPFKQAVIAWLDDLDESAELVGAVNTIAMRGGRLTGHNTDMRGFRDSMAEELPGVRMQSVLQLGAGGAGSAVASAMLSLGAERLEILDVDAERAQALAAGLGARFGSHRIAARAVGDDRADETDGIINATPIGMAAHPGTPLPPEEIAPWHWVADIVYFPLETELLRTARSIGCRTLDGSGMVIRQAALAFEIITGMQADKERMRNSFYASYP
jgi:shikimate dehydrogenase